VGWCMGWYFRKSLAIGPLRLNLGKRGIGVSAGVKGARIGVDASGDSYVTAGRYGFYYRQRLGVKVHSGLNRRWLWIVASILIAVALVVVLSRKGTPGIGSEPRQGDANDGAGTV